LIIWGFALFTYFIFTLKTNCVFAGIFLFVTIACWILSGAYWKVSRGDYATAHTLQVVSCHIVCVRDEWLTMFARTDWRGVTVHRGPSWLVYVFCDDGC